jgi:hypothetical protein
MADTRLRSYLNDSKPIDLKKNEGMRVLMAIKGNLDQSKNPNATRFAAAEMAIEKVSLYHSYVLHFAQFLLLNWALVRFSRFLRAAASNFCELMVSYTSYTVRFALPAGRQNLRLQRVCCALQ